MRYASRTDNVDLPRHSKRVESVGAGHAFVVDSNVPIRRDRVAQNRILGYLDSCELENILSMKGVERMTEGVRRCLPDHAT